MMRDAVQRPIGLGTPQLKFNGPLLPLISLERGLKRGNGDKAQKDVAGSRIHVKPVDAVLTAELPN